MPRCASTPSPALPRRKSLFLTLGISLGLSNTLNRLLEVTIEAIRPIPSIALLPIALIALGFGYRMEIIRGFIMCCMVHYLRLMELDRII